MENACAGRKKESDFEFIAYNPVFAESIGKFTTETIYRKLKSHKIETAKSRLEQLFYKWMKKGLRGKRLPRQPV